ncbi:(2Fe-2S)-binding protein [Solimonas sp. K1W22B-7]|uniref:(2Fe-2S)-binding protein n=1 Tax=Solimonas sp. K1W22B-7 TaxID=2303331 RepID=UPI000E32F5C5|nr:(2Fe-2S)-binding protein [Solimonas sp. K1W22B-7]AXQ27435.1 (2Fe-2S)-binding protein [Solimonas sp. K1W22B-7]
MIVCVCKAVSDRHIRRAAAAGEVVSLRDLTRELGLGTCCGKCVPAAREVLDEALAARPAAALMMGAAANQPAMLSA